MDFSKIPVVVLFVITLVCAVASSNYKAYYVKKTMKNESEQYSFNAGASLVCAIVLFLSLWFYALITKSDDYVFVHCYCKAKR